MICGDFYLMRAKQRRKRRSKNNSDNISKLIILVILILFFSFLINFKRIVSLFVSGDSGTQLILSKSLGNNLRLIPPTPTLTPTPTPTPTPFPLIGYCLNVPVLMYHHVQPTAEAHSKGQSALSVDNGQFDLQMGYLVSSGYSLISAQQLVDALTNKTGLPPKSIVVTFDDGYNDIYSYAYPVLQKYHIVGNLGVITGLVGGADYVSWGQVEEMSRSGLMQMVNHTWSHYSVTQSADKARYEVSTAKQQLQDHTGQNINTFVYPYGAVNSSAIAVLQQEGVTGAFSEIGGHWQCDSFIMALHRTRIGNSPLSYYGL
jgi:peptidoglycan/xylan/chitin deacetylase (PgdA/CDA1 family)